MFTLPPGTMLSIFCRISSDTSFSELMSGTTSSCNTTFLYSMLAETAAWLFITPPTFEFVRVLTGTGTSCPEAMMAFLLLLLKAVGRERTLKRLVDSSRCTIAAKALPAARKILVPLPTFWMIWLKLIRLAGSRILGTPRATLLPGATEEPGIGTPGSLVLKMLLLREVPTNLLLYF